VKSYVSKIQDLEGELLQLKTSSATNSSHFVDCFDSDDDGYGSKHALFAPGLFTSDCDVKAVTISGYSALGISFCYCGAVHLTGTVKRLKIKLYLY